MSTAVHRESVRDPLGAIMSLAERLTGIRLPESKRAMVEMRLGKRLRKLGLDLAAYARLVEREEDERLALIDLITTNHTAWWRESAHFDDLLERVLPPLAARGSVRIWCAAAATGEEPWSIALCVRKALGHLPALESWILATDISTRALSVAQAGRYSDEQVSALEVGDRALALRRQGRAGEQRPWSVRPELRRMVQFARLNLIGPWPDVGTFDAIFCRNVMIYFDRSTQQRLVERLCAALRPGGTLYVGHTESLASIRHPLRTLRPAVHVAR